MRIFLSLLFFISVSQSVWAQNDTIVFESGEYIIGEIKSMDKGVCIMETNYSDSDFKIEWIKVKELYTLQKFLISLKTGERFNGSIRAESADSARLYTYSYGTVVAPLSDIVFLKGINDKLKDRLYYSIDLGLSLTKANSLKQFTSRSNISYTASTWILSSSINSLISNQEELEKTERTDGTINFKYILQKGWFFFPEITFLSNTEQQLNLRTTVKLGAGKFLIRTNKAYWSLTMGIANNNENYSNVEETRNSREGFFGTDLDLFDIGDLDFALKTVAYPSFTESGRWRADFTLDIKYDLPFDIYIKLGTTTNYDNQPVEEGTEFDYVIQTGIGWEFD